jgi:hypothetical protein
VFPASVPGIIERPIKVLFWKDPIMRTWLTRAALAALLAFGGTSAAKAQVFVQPTVFSPTVYSYSYVPGPVVTPVYTYSYSAYPAYSGISVGFGTYPSWGYQPYYGGWGGGYWSGYWGGYRGGWGGGHHHYHR